MKNDEVVRIAIAESSVIVREGLVATLKLLPNIKIQPIELLSPGMIEDYLLLHYPKILIVNPNFGGTFDVAAVREQIMSDKIYFVALVTSLVDSASLSKYDETISIFDDIEVLTQKIHGLLNVRIEDGSAIVLSQREKEIIVCVVKGLTNKEIADKLCLSVHTVITHRRNISKKLQIHSTAGLTIYAIVNKLISLSEIG